MSVDLDRQIAEYCRLMDEKQGGLSFEDILERSGELQAIPGGGNRPLVPRRRWIAVAAAALTVLIVVIGIRLLPATDVTPDPADPPTVTSVPAPSTVGPPTTADPDIEPWLSYQFVPTGNLAQGCAWCPAVLLTDGRVLVLGGWPSIEGAGRVAELFNPATGTFSTTGRPAGDFDQGSAVPLDDGRVLVIFGLSERAEVYDPATGEFETTDIAYPQGQGGVAVKLTDGRVLLLGYNEGPSGIFDPSNDTFATVASPGLGGEFDAVLLEGGDVLIVDGQQAMTFDPVEGTFAKTGELITPRGGYTLTRLLDGRVLIAGGQELVEPYDLVSQAEIYDPETTAFTVAGHMNVPRWWHAATRLSDGRVMLVGGTGGSPSGLDSAEIFDPATSEFRLVTSRMTRPRVAGTAITLNDGRVLVFGHYPGNGFGSDAGSSTAEVFTQGRQVDEGEGAATGNPTEVDAEATFDLTPVLSRGSGSTELRARLLIPPGSLEGVSEMHALATLDVEGAPSTGTITIEVGAPFSQVLTWDLSEGSGGSGGGGEVDLDAACDAGCDMTIPVTVSWTGDVATGILGLRLQFAYAGSPPYASEGLGLTMVNP